MPDKNVLSAETKGKHAAGPWVSQPETFGQGIFILPADASNDETAVAVVIGRPERRENAALIAAAPEMLYALKAMLRHSCVADSAAEDKDPDDHSAERLARQAVAKAEGLR